MGNSDLILFISILFQIYLGVSFYVQSLLLAILLLGEQVLVDQEVDRAGENFQNSDYWSEIDIKSYRFVPRKWVLICLTLHFP